MSVPRCLPGRCWHDRMSTQSSGSSGRLCSGGCAEKMQCPLRSPLTLLPPATGSQQAFVAACETQANGKERGTVNGTHG